MLLNQPTNSTADRTRKLISLLDAIYDAPADASCTTTLFDSTGEIVKVLRSWACAREVRLDRETLITSGTAQDMWRMTSPDGLSTLTVHDERTRRVVGERARNDETQVVDVDAWSPAQVVTR